MATVHGTPRLDLKSHLGCHSYLGRPGKTPKLFVTKFFSPTVMIRAMHKLTSDMLIKGYALGIFPMAENRDEATLHWVDPELRGILPLDGFHVPRSLKKVVRHHRFEVRIDSAFVQVIDQCAASAPGRPETWINATIRDLFIDLHARGMAHSVETWDGDRLVGGLYGLALGAAFFGESMFSRATDASKVALVHLVALLRDGGFSLLDTQFVTEHLAQFGVIEIPRATYHSMLEQALQRPAQFARTPLNADQVLLGA